MEQEKVTIEMGRAILKPDWNQWRETPSDQALGKPIPELQKPYDEGSKLFDLSPINKISCGDVSFVDVLSRRKSSRKFNSNLLSFDELSYLLWATQGVREKHEKFTMRTVPSGGARHCFETYLFIQRVEGLEQGLYRYLPLDHKLCLLSSENEGKLNAVMSNQNFDCAVTFLWTAIPYRMEWRYNVVSHKMIAIDVGHVCQNLYLAAESIGCGCCAIGAYNQEEIDSVLNVDGEEEFTIYMAAVGKLDKT